MSSYVKFIMIGVGAAAIICGAVRYLLNMEEEHSQNERRSGSRPWRRSPPRRSSSSDNSMVIVPKECQICSREQDELVVFLPCMHCTSCISCAPRMQRCITCDRPIAERITEVTNKTIPINREDETICSICLDNKKRIVFNCGHTVCNKCSLRLQQCPMCRKPITSRTEFF